MNAACNQKTTSQCQDRVDIADHSCTGSENNSTCCWSNDGLNNVIDVIDSRNFIYQHLNDHQHSQQDQDPCICQCVPGWTQFDQISVMGGYTNHQERNICCL